MRAPWPKSLAGQLIVLLLLALVVAQAVMFFLLLRERHDAVEGAIREEILARTAAMVRLLDETPADLHPQVLATGSSERLRYWIEGESAIDPNDVRARTNRMSQYLSGLLGGGHVVLVRVIDRDGDPADWPAFGHRHRGHDDDDDEDEEDEHHRWRDRERPAGLAVAVSLDGGRWLNAAVEFRFAAWRWAGATMISMAVAAVLIVLVVVLVVRRITKPVARLAAAAGAVGKGEGAAPLPETGTEEIRQATRAFNAMRERLERFVADRTRMLAAISHDLRTPITTLRLRAELLEDGEARDKILETLDEMMRMADETLAFAREESAQEDTRDVDLTALVASVAADFEDTGHDVRFADGPAVAYRGRPVALKRVLRNLIGNAVTYGKRARVALIESGDSVEIRIDDDGPGIPDAELSRVFEPFVRLEASRSRETGGVGLGLAIARSIVHGHGGTLDLSNRAEGGLRATVRLPKA